MIIKTFQFKGIAIARDIPESDVPCGPCSLCCKNLSPFLTPEEFQSGKYIYTFLKVDGIDEPVIAVPRNEQGGCIYYINNKCSIYNKRPLSCRQFDCRSPETGHPKISNQFE